MIKSCPSGSNTLSVVLILSCFSFHHTNVLNTGAMLSLLTDTHVAWVSGMEWVGKIKSVQRVAFLSLSLQPANNGGINGTQHNSPLLLDFLFSPRMIVFKSLKSQGGKVIQCLYYSYVIILVCQTWRNTKVFLPHPKEILRCIKVSCPKWTQIKLKRFGVIGARRCEGGGRDLMRKLVPITGRGHHCPPSFAAFQGVEQCLGCNIYFHLDKSSTLKTDCLR